MARARSSSPPPPKPWYCPNTRAEVLVGAHQTNPHGPACAHQQPRTPTVAQHPARTPRLWSPESRKPEFPLAPAALSGQQPASTAPAAHLPAPARPSRNYSAPSRPAAQPKTTPLPYPTKGQDVTRAPPMEHHTLTTLPLHPTHSQSNNHQPSTVHRGQRLTVPYASAPVRPRHHHGAQQQQEQQAQQQLRPRAPLSALLTSRGLRLDRSWHVGRISLPIRGMRAHAASSSHGTSRDQWRTRALQPRCACGFEGDMCEKCDPS